jgi:hypothetical protein
MDLLKQASFAEDYEELFKTFRVQIIPGSSLALTKEREYAMYATLFSMGAIDRQAFLEFIELPRREEILQRMAQAQAMLPQAVARAGPAPRGRGATITRTLLRQLAGETMGGRPGT